MSWPGSDCHGKNGTLALKAICFQHVFNNPNTCLCVMCVCISSTSVDVCKVCRAAVCMCLALEIGRRDLTRAESQTGSDVLVQITGPRWCTSRAEPSWCLACHLQRKSKPLEQSKRREQQRPSHWLFWTYKTNKQVEIVTQAWLIVNKQSLPSHFQAAALHW